MTGKEIAKAIRTELKKIGYTSKEVSVTTDRGCQFEAVYLSSKLADIPRELLKALAKTYETENTFIFVR